MSVLCAHARSRDSSSSDASVLLTLRSYGMDRVFSNKTHFMVMYNMGSEATQATLFAFDSYNTTDRNAAGARVNKTVGQATVLAKAWDTSLGGRHFDRVLVEYVADRFNAVRKHACWLYISILSVPR